MPSLHRCLKTGNIWPRLTANTQSAFAPCLVDDVGNFSYGPGTLLSALAMLVDFEDSSVFAKLTSLPSLTFSSRPLHETQANANGPQHGRQLRSVQAHGCRGK